MSRILACIDNSAAARPVLAAARVLAPVLNATVQAVHVRENGDRPLTAVLHGRRRELTNRSLAAALVRYPLMPQRVTGLIHWQAAKLWRKGVPFHHKPPFVPGQGSVKA